MKVDSCNVYIDPNMWCKIVLSIHVTIGSMFDDIFLKSYLLVLCNDNVIIT